MTDRKIRLKKGLSGEELISFCKRYITDGSFLDVYSIDNIDYKLIQQRISQGKTTSCIINTSKADEKGEHWVAVYFPKDRAGETEYFDSFGLPPIQRATQQLCEITGDYSWNEEHPIQDVLDQKSISCGHHVLFYLYAKHEKPEMKLGDLVREYFSDWDFRRNDLFATCFIESKM